jgi:hypothetical protein
LTSSIPATSANVTVSPDGWYRRARDRPNAPSIPCTFPARRVAKTSRATSRIVGPKPSRTLSHQGALELSGLAFTTTPFDSSSLDRALVSAKAGISVRKRVDALDPL